MLTQLTDGDGKYLQPSRLLAPDFVKIRCIFLQTFASDILKIFAAHASIILQIVIFSHSGLIFYFMKIILYLLQLTWRGLCFFLRLSMLVSVLVFMLVLQIFLSPFDVVKCSNYFGIWWIFLSSASISKVRFVYFVYFSPFHVWHRQVQQLTRCSWEPPIFQFCS